MTDRELMQQALEALKSIAWPKGSVVFLTITALRERLAQPEQEQWDAIPDAFNEWWNADYDDTGNPYRKDSPAYWAWSGWKAASKQPEQKPVAWLYPEGLEALRSGKPWTAYGGIGNGPHPDGVQRIPLYLNDAVALRVEPPAAESGAGFESLPASPNQPEQEPVITKDGEGMLLHGGWHSLPDGAKLYTAPPQRKPLTDEEIEEVFFDMGQFAKIDLKAFARAIEAAHGIGEKPDAA